MKLFLIKAELQYSKIRKTLNRLEFLLWIFLNSMNNLIDNIIIFSEVTYSSLFVLRSKIRFWQVNMSLYKPDFISKGCKAPFIRIIDWLCSLDMHKSNPNLQNVDKLDKKTIDHSQYYQPLLNCTNKISIDVFLTTFG